MILFLYGEENYLSHEKLQSIKAKYIDASFGDTNLFTADVADKKMDNKEFGRMILAVPFLAKTRLVILKNLLRAGSKKLQEAILKSLAQVPKSTVLVFYENNLPDKRSKLFKTLIKTAKSQEFKKLNEQKLALWIKHELKSKIPKLPKNINYEFLKQMFARSKNDLYEISNNIQKLSLYLDITKEINKVELLSLISENKEANVFDFIDFLGKRNATSALNLLHKMLLGGENEIYIFSMIIYQLRNMLIIKDAMQDFDDRMSYQSAQAIAQKLAINPYVVRKTINYLANFTYQELVGIYQLMLKFDLMIKRGKINPGLALDMIVIKICR